MIRKPKTPKTPKIEDPFSRGHHMGKHTGYDVLEDGSIHLFPAVTDPMIAVLDREEGLRNLLKAVTDHVAKELTETAKMRREWWTRVAEDIGIDCGQLWLFNTYTQNIALQPEPEKP